MASKIHRIVLTGGPCAGKSTALTYLDDKLSALGFTVYKVPEVARMILGSGVSPRQFSSDLSLQQSLLHGQINIDNTYNYLARSTTDDARVVLLFDRGRMDVKAFSNEDTWAVLLQEGRWSEVELRDEPYDAVVHMVTAAIGASAAYINDDVRKETPDQAAMYDVKLRDAWTGHPHLDIIKNLNDGLDGKLRRTLASVLRFIGHPIPVEIERKYLVNAVEFDKFTGKVEVVDIEQIYLLEPGQRIRRRGQNGRYVYTLTQKLPIKGTLERMETEEQISIREYNNLKLYRDPQKVTINKFRHCFIWESQYFELDIFENGLMLLELEVSSTQQVVYLPPWIDIASEVTDNQMYSNSNIADAVTGIGLKRSMNI